MVNVFEIKVLESLEKGFEPVFVYYQLEPSKVAEFVANKLLLGEVSTVLEALEQHEIFWSFAHTIEEDMQKEGCYEDEDIPTFEEMLNNTYELAEYLLSKEQK